MHSLMNGAAFSLLVLFCSSLTPFFRWHASCAVEAAMKCDGSWEGVGLGSESGGRLCVSENFGDGFEAAAVACYEDVRHRVGMHGSCNGRC